MKKKKLRYNDLVKIIKEQVNGEYYEITPKKYLELMLLAAYDGNSLSKIKMFQGKKLKITGDLNISGKPVTDLGNIGMIDGGLDISNTNVMSVGDINVVGNIRDWNSGVYRAKMRKIKMAKLSEADSLRESGEWSLTNEDIDSDGEKANAIFQFLVNNGNVESLDDEDKEEVNRLKTQISDLTNDYEDEDDPELSDAIYDQISVLEEELDDLIEDKFDVYNLSPNSYSDYGLSSFEILEGPDSGHEYSVGDESEMDDAAREQIRNLVDESGVDGFVQGYVDNYIDLEELEKYAYDFYYDDISYSPESYFSDEDFVLTDEQEERISQIEDKISIYEDEQSEAHEDDYDEYQDLIDELQEELDEIIPDTEPTEEMIEEKCDEYAKDARNEGAEWITEHGLDIKNFVDEEDLIDGVFDDDGYDGLLRYDGTYQVETINDTDYYVFRTD